MKAIIYLKHNPTPIEVDVESIKSTTDTKGENFTNLTWTTPEKRKAKLHDIALNEIAAIVVKEA